MHFVFHENICDIIKRENEKGGKRYLQNSNELYVIKLDISNDNYYTYWRLWSNEEQVKEIVADREKEYGVSKVSFYKGNEEDLELGATHLIDDKGHLWAKTGIKVKV